MVGINNLLADETGINRDVSIYNKGMWAVKKHQHNKMTKMTN